MSNLFPDWAEALGNGRVRLQADKFYPQIISELSDITFSDDSGLREIKEDQGLPSEDSDFWKEAAYQIAKLRIQDIAKVDHSVGVKKGGALVLLINDDSKSESGVSKWKQTTDIKIKRSIINIIYTQM